MPSRSVSRGGHYLEERGRLARNERDERETVHVSEHLVPRRG